MRIIKSVERWFRVPADPDKGEVLIKHLTPGEVSDIMDQALSQKMEYKVGDSDDQSVIINNNKKLDRELTIKKVIVDWKNFFDADGKELKCSDQNKIRACREIYGLNELIKTWREELAEDFETKKELLEKN